MKKLVSTRKYTRVPFDYTKEYQNRKREYEDALAKALEFDRNNPNFTGDFDDTYEGMRLWRAIRRLKGRF